MPGDAGWSLVLAHQGLPPLEPLLPQGLLPRKGLWGLVGAGSHKPQGAGCLVCAHRLAGRMAWRSLLLLPFLLAAGEDFARWLAWVVRRHWRCFQPPTLIPNSLRAAGTTKTAAHPNGNLAAPMTTLLPQGKAARAGGWAVGTSPSMGNAVGGQVWSSGGRCGMSTWKVRGGVFPCLPQRPKPCPGAGAGAR